MNVLSSIFPSDHHLAPFFTQTGLSKIPDWVRNNAGWWSEGKISDDDFLLGIGFMIQNEIITIQNLPEQTTDGSDEVPVWVKNGARWWSEGKIDDNTFIQGIQFLVQKGIIKV